MKKRYVLVALLGVASLLQAAAEDEGQELNRVINAQADAQSKVLAGLQYLSASPVNATPLAQGSFPFLHALKEALQSEAISKDDLQAYKKVFAPVIAPLAGVMQSAHWNNRVEQLYSDLEAKQSQKKSFEIAELVKSLDDAAIAKIRQASGTIGDMTADIASQDKEAVKEGIEIALQFAVENFELDGTQAKALFDTLVIDDESAMRAYIAGLDKDTKVALLEAANYLNAPLLQNMSSASLEGVLTQDEVGKLPVELAEPVMRNAVNKALDNYAAWSDAPRVLRGHEYEVVSVAFSPDGTKIASGSADRTVRIWDVASGTQIGEPLRGHRNEVWSVAFSPDGTKIVSGSYDRTVRIWDVASGTQIGEPLRGHEDWVISVAFSPDGTKIASGSNDGTVLIWNVASGTQIGESLRGHESEVISVAFSPDGTKIVSFSNDDMVLIWDVASGAQIGEPLRVHRDWVWSAALSPDGTKTASGSGDYAVRIWDVARGTQIGEPLRGHEDWVGSVAFSPDGTKIVSGSGDKTVRIWQNYQALVDQCTLNELLLLYQALPSWQVKAPYVVSVEQLAALKEQYKDSIIAPLINDGRLFSSSAAAI